MKATMLQFQDDTLLSFQVEEKTGWLEMRYTIKGLTITQRMTPGAAKQILDFLKEHF